MQIDPRNQRTAADRTRRRPGRGAHRSSSSSRSTVASARENLALSRENLRRQQELWAQQLTTRQALERAESEVKVRETNLRDAEQSLGTAGAAHPRGGRDRRRARSTSCRRPASSRRSTASIVRRNIEAGRDGGHRHDEQRRHGAADRSPTCRSSRPRSRSTRPTSRSSRSASRPRSRSTPSRTRPSPAR